MTTQKEIAQELDRAAARAEHVSAYGATGKQCWFLAHLMLKNGDDASAWELDCTHTNAILTKKKASFIIDQYLNGPTLN